MIDWLESNPVTAVHWVSSPTVPLGDFSSISNPCHLLPKKKNSLSSQIHVVFKHLWWSDNAIADSLAKQEVCHRFVPFVVCSLLVGYNALYHCFFL